MLTHSNEYWYSKWYCSHKTATGDQLSLIKHPPAKLPSFLNLGAQYDAMNAKSEEDSSLMR